MSAFRTPSLLALGALLISALQLQAGTWTLDQALAAARQNNPDVRLARLRIEAAQAMEQQAGAGALPQVSVSGGYSASNRAMPAFGSILNQRAFNPTLDFNRPGTVDDLSLSGTVSYSLYSGGRVTAGRNAARAGLQAAELDSQAAEQQLSAAVVRAYLSVRQAREALAAVEAGVKAQEASLAVAQARFDAGQLLKADLLNLEVQVAQLRELQASARHRAALVARAFLLLLGEGKEATVELPAQDSSLEALALPASFAPDLRPELAAMQARCRAAEEQLRAARGGRQPSVNAFASYGFNHGWQSARNAEGWVAGVSVDLKVFDGGQTQGQIRQARAELAQAQELLRKLQLGISLEIEQARLANADAAERLQVSTRTVSQAEESAQLSRARFEKGALLSADLIGVESRLLEARLRRSMAEAEERSSLAELRRAAGLPLFEAAKP